MSPQSNENIIADIKIQFEGRVVTAVCQKALSAEPRMLIFSFSDPQDANYVSEINQGDSQIIFTYNEEKGMWQFPGKLFEQKTAIKDIREFKDSQNMRPLPPL